MNYKIYTKGEWKTMYKYKGRYYKVEGYQGDKALLKEYRKVLWFYIPKKQKAFYASCRELKKMKWV